MKKIAVVCLLLGLVGCGKVEPETVSPPQTQFAEPDPIKRGIAALDAIYASEQALMKLGMPGIDSVLADLQNALWMWPNGGVDGGSTEGEDACRMALRIQATYMLNIKDQFDMPVDQRTPTYKDDRSSEFRLACRKAVNYVYDDARIHQVWDKFTGSSKKITH